MTDMKTTFLGLLLLTATAISAQEQARTFQLADAPRYSEETGYGYDLAPTPEKESKAPFFFSVRVPDGNYKVTVRLGSKKQAGVTTVCQSISIEPADPSVITVFLCGNSTVVDQDNEPWASWGQMIPHFFGTDVCIANYAESGESANTFIGAKRLAKALSQIKKGDYLFMEFGHNDQKQKGPGKGAYYSFMTSLKTFIDEARARGAHPVLVTPTQRRSFDANGHIRDTHEDYPEAMRWLAAKENVPLIDLNEMTRTLYEALGPDTSKRAFVHYPAGTYPGQTRDFADNTHFNPYGAYQIAQCVIEGMKKAVPELAKHLKIDPAYNPAHPDDVNTFHWNDSPFTEIEKPDGN